MGCPHSKQNRHSECAGDGKQVEISWPTSVQHTSGHESSMTILCHSCGLPSRQFCFYTFDKCCLNVADAICACPDSPSAYSPRNDSLNSNYSINNSKILPTSFFVFDDDDTQDPLDCNDECQSSRPTRDSIMKLLQHRLSHRQDSSSSYAESYLTFLDDDDDDDKSMVDDEVLPKDTMLDSEAFGPRLRIIGRQPFDLLANHECEEKHQVSHTGGMEVSTRGCVKVFRVRMGSKVEHML